MRRGNVRAVVAAAAVVLWLFGLVAGYFWAHKPFDVRQAASLGRVAFAVGVWLGVTALAAALGRALIGRWLADEDVLARLALSTGLGLGVISLLVLALGLVGLLRPAVAWAVVILLGLGLVRPLASTLADLRALPLPRPSGRFERWVLLYSVVSLACAFIAALAPPSAWDALVYHLNGPRLYIEAGRIGHPLDLPYLGFPQLGEMPFVLGLLLAGDGAAALFHFGYGVLTLALSAALARRAFGPRAGGLAVVLLLSVPTFLTLMGRAYVDLALAFYVTAAGYALLRWQEALAGEARTAPPGAPGGDVGGEPSVHAIRWLVLAGLQCGFCLGVKYTAVAIPAAVAAGVLWRCRRAGLRRALGRVLIVLGVAGTIFMPWLLKNWLTTGNPLYPFLLARGIYWDAWRRWWYDRPGTGLAATAPWRLLLAPLEATILGTEGTAMYDATIGPLLLAAAGLLVAVWRRLGRSARAAAGSLFVVSGAHYLLWLAGMARTALLVQTRLLMPVFGLVACLGAAGLANLERLRWPTLNLGWLARAVVSLTLALLLFSTVVALVRADPLRVVLGLEGRDDYLARQLGWHFVALQGLNQHLGPDAVILFLWEPRSYYCQRRCLPDALLDRWLHTTHLYGPDARAIAAAWRAQGITHVLLHRAGYESVLEARYDPLTEADQVALSTLLGEHMRLVSDFGGAYELYAWAEGGGP